MEEVVEGDQNFTSLVKLLASSNKATRDKTLRVIIKTWLPTQTSLSDGDMKKLWKGLFYCVWHADKVPVQSELINRLASLLLHLDLSLAVQYFSVFLLTMRREWAGIDALRLDKFYLLIRRFLHQFFALLKKHSWDLELCRCLVQVLEERVFFTDDKFHGNGVNYQIASVFLEELRPFLPLQKEVVDVLFKPFLLSMAKLPDKVLFGKIKSNLFDVILKMGKQLLESRKRGDDIDSGDDTAVYGTISLTNQFSTTFYELGSSPDCCQGNRKVLFAMHEEFQKLEKDFFSSGIEISFPDLQEQDGDEVPTLVPILSEEEAPSEISMVDVDVDAESTDKALKKQKRSKKATDGSGKKKAKKAKKAKKTTNGISDLVSENSPANKDNENIVVANGENSNNEQISDGNMITFDETVISNLQMQFEKVAAEADFGDSIVSPVISTNGSVKKRKRAKNVDELQKHDVALPSEAQAEGNTAAKSEEKSVKKVRFSMKNNLVWKPHNPLPPESLRLPPSVTPRGSALKKGIPPGPILEFPATTKRTKRRAVSMRTKKGVRSLPVKRLKKLKSKST
ncbi:ribosomal RNA processing protein 1-like protein [Cucumis melo var. makuwa]|uniref:Ribosomal RNA processing protein 1-like protein n=2 Tax=Cucumis melo TaxID=3656 RepID=A0A5A7U008_CUCMM|nr:ribosomal RNA processing protein 1-like protein [Cucumis melo var. makuwa]TYK14953.1 ribosomal RNA processing protein 1-like protein [Cucumis melo var. makuwa]